jgi:hypothetical protein
MQWKIEPAEAKREVYSSGVRRQEEGRDSCVLDLIMQRQELEHWCWAAIAVSLGAFYGTRRMMQHEAAGALLGMDCSGFQSEPDVVSRCDVCAMLDDALKLVGCFSHWSPGRPTFERIRTEIDAGRPVCFCVDWKTGGSHYAVISGYYANTREVYVADPLHGPSVQAYSTFPTQYRGIGGFWRGTFWTSPPVTQTWD